MIPNSRIQSLVHALAALAAVLSLMAAAPSAGKPEAQPGAPHQAQTATRMPPLTEEQAIALAVNDLDATMGGWSLSHPRHTAEFTRHGLSFSPRGGGPAWAWQLTFVGAGSVPLAGVDVGRVPPNRTANQPEAVAYPRGGLVEQYLARQEAVEQQFLIPEPLALGSANLVIAGRVTSTGVFDVSEDGWRWHTEEGEVRLGNVHVFDAAGRPLPAEMTVTASETQIVVDGAALARAAYPVTIDPEIGANDFRLSDMGPDGSAAYDANDPAVAYNSTDNQYLVVWAGDDDNAPVSDGEFEIFGQRVNAATGAEIGLDFRVSDMGPVMSDTFDAETPAVAYNSTTNEYLVVWRGDDTTDGEFEIFGQRVDAATGGLFGLDFRLSEMGTDGVITTTASTPAVAYNSANNEYLVVWSGDPVTGMLVDDEFEIFGQLVTASGVMTGTNDFRISNMGADGNAARDATDPAVAYNSAGNQYLVVWRGDDAFNDEFDIYGQLVSADGSEVGSDFRLSDMGPTGTGTFDAFDPAVAYNSADGQFLVVWRGDDNTPPLIDNEYEIFGQLVTASGVVTGTDDFPLSDMGPDGDSVYTATVPAVAYNSTDNAYLVVWQANDTGSQADLEIYAQAVDGTTGAEMGPNDTRLSDMGPDGVISYTATAPAVAYAYTGTVKSFLVVWQGDDDTPPLVDEENEIFGQRFAFGGDLAIAKSDRPDPVNAGTTLTYTLNATNNGFDIASSLTVTDILPSGVTSPSASGPGWTCTLPGGVVRCTRASLAIGAAAGFTITVTAPTGGGVITNTAIITSTSADANAANNTATITTTVTPVANLAITKVVTPSLVAPGRAITYTLRYTNTGPSTATGVLITDIVPITVTNLAYTRSGPVITPTGSVSYTWQVANLSTSQSGVITITGILTSGLSAGLTFTNTATITGTAVDSNTTNNASSVGVTIANAAPVAGDDTASTPEDTPVSISVLANDSDANGSPLTVVAVGTPVTGTAAISGTTQIVYTPTLNFNGTASFTYTVSDGSLSDSGLVTVTVTPVNDPPVANAGPDQSVAVNALVTLDGSASTDLDGPPPLTYRWTQTGGTAVVLSNQAISLPTFTAPGAPSVLTFTLAVTDALGLPDLTPDAVVITVTEVAISGLTAASSSPTTLSNPTFFTATIAAGSNVTYRWNFGDGITATITSTTTSHAYGAVGVYTAVVTATNSINSMTASTPVTVNDTPLAANDAYTGTEDIPMTVAAPGVLANDTDAFGGPLTAILASGPTTGTLTLSASGAFTYTPPLNFNGVVTFTYRASDGALTSSPATVALTVNAVNDSPTISNIADQVIAANSSTGPIMFTVGDVDGDTLTVTGDSSNTALVPVANIVFGGSGANRTVTITPAAAQSGTTTITVTVSDGNGGSASDTFVLTVTLFKLYLPLIRR